MPTAEIAKGVFLHTERVDSPQLYFQYEIECQSDKIAEVCLDITGSANISFADGTLTKRTVIFPRERVQAGRAIILNIEEPWSLKSSYELTMRPVDVMKPLQLGEAIALYSFVDASTSMEVHQGNSYRIGSGSGMWSFVVDSNGRYGSAPRAYFHLLPSSPPPLPTSPLPTKQTLARLAKRAGLSTAAAAPQVTTSAPPLPLLPSPAPAAPAAAPAVRRRSSSVNRVAASRRGSRRGSIDRSGLSCVVSGCPNTRSSRAGYCIAHNSNSNSNSGGGATTTAPAAAAVAVATPPSLPSRPAPASTSRVPSTDAETLAAALRAAPQLPSSQPPPLTAATATATAAAPRAPPARPVSGAPALPSRLSSQLAAPPLPARPASASLTQREAAAGGGGNAGMWISRAGAALEEEEEEEGAGSAALTRGGGGGSDGGGGGGGGIGGLRGGTQAERLLRLAGSDNSPHSFNSPEALDFPVSYGAAAAAGAETAGTAAGGGASGGLLPWRSSLPHDLASTRLNISLPEAFLVEVLPPLPPNGGAAGSSSGDSDSSGRLPVCPCLVTPDDSVGSVMKQALTRAKRSLAIANAKKITPPGAAAAAAAAASPPSAARVSTGSSAPVVAPCLDPLQLVLKVVGRNEYLPFTGKCLADYTHITHTLRHGGKVRLELVPVTVAVATATDLDPQRISMAPEAEEEAKSPSSSSPAISPRRVAQPQVIAAAAAFASASSTKKSSKFKFRFGFAGRKGKAAAAEAAAAGAHAAAAEAAAGDIVDPFAVGPESYQPVLAAAAWLQQERVRALPDSFLPASECGLEYNIRLHLLSRIKGQLLALNGGGGGGGSGSGSGGSGSGSGSGSGTAHTQLFVRASLLFGGKVLEEVVSPETRTSAALGHTVSWTPEWLSLRLPVQRLPLGTRLVIDVMARSKGMTRAVALAGGAMNIFNHHHILATGSISLSLWPSRMGQRLLTPEDNPSPNCPCLQLHVLNHAPLTPVCYTFQERDTCPAPASPDALPNAAAALAALPSEVSDLASRPQLEMFTERERDMLWQWRERLMQVPNALSRVLQTVDWCDSEQVDSMLSLLPSWEPPSTLQALELLYFRHGHWAVREYAVRILAALDDHHLAELLLQLTQALKFEAYHRSGLALFLLRRATQSPSIVGNKLFWHLRSEMSCNFASQRYGLLLQAYLTSIGKLRSALHDQVTVVDTLAAAALDIMRDCAAEADKERKKAIARNRLSAAGSQLPRQFQLPTDAPSVARGLKTSKCKVMSSKKKPLWLVCDNADENGDDIYVMFKQGDDLRQDQMTLQLLRVMDMLWLSEGLNLLLTPYQCVSTGVEQGMLEIVTHSDTTANIQKAQGSVLGAINDQSIKRFLEQHNTSAAAYAKAVDNFVHSCAGYCVATYVMGIGDRHSDNIMVKESGHLFHIDFGHFLGHFKTKLGWKRERTPFVFTPEMAHVMGGKRGEAYAKFVMLCCRAFNILRKHTNVLVSLFKLVIPAGMPELTAEADIGYLVDRLAPDLGDSTEGMARANELMTREIESCLGDTYRRIDNAIHNIKTG